MIFGDPSSDRSLLCVGELGIHLELRALLCARGLGLPWGQGGMWEGKGWGVSAPPALWESDSQVL